MQFSDAVQSKLRKLLGDKAPAFIREAQEHAHLYREYVNAEVPPDAVKTARKTVENIAKRSEELAVALAAMDSVAREALEQAFASEAGDLLEHIRSVERVAQRARRASTFKMLNPPPNAPTDRDKRGLARRCAVTYQRITGETDEQMCSRSGTFVVVLLIVLQTARAIPTKQKSLNSAFLRDVCRGDVSTSPATK